MPHRLPAEWEPHLATLVAWPAAEELWQEDLPAAQTEWLDLCRAIVEKPQRGSSDLLIVLARNERESKTAQEALSSSGLSRDLVKFLTIDYGDIWLRDTAPIFTRDEGSLTAIGFRFNGWGQKYCFEPDLVLAATLAQRLKVNFIQNELVTEGGALEWNEDGLLLTTESCLVDEKRNPGLSRAQAERELQESLGFNRILWLKRGMINDHTDGHIDTLVRFAPGKKILLMQSKDEDDPQREILNEIEADLRNMMPLLPGYELVICPSPGQILDADGEIMPASYMNFYISNGAVIVPTYASRYDEEAVRLIGACFTDRKVVGCSARSILTGGGAFHCITQQIPLLSERL